MHEKFLEMPCAKQRRYRVASVARIVALRGWLEISAASPKTSPGWSFATIAPSRSTSASALDDEIDFVAKIAIGENRFSGLEMLAVHRLFVKEPELRDVAWQEDIENPVSNQAKLAVQARKFRDVNATPQ